MELSKFAFLTLFLGLAVLLPLAIAQETASRQEQAMTPASPAWMQPSQQKLEQELIAKYGESQRARLQRGLEQVAGFWRNEDGGQGAFEDFVRTNFAGTPEALDVMFQRYERLLEQLDGHMLEIILEFRRQSDLDRGPIQPFDERFAGYDPSAHATEDFFNNKLAFIVLLNFPLTTLEQRLQAGDDWSRRQWAEVRLAERYSKRIPAEVNLAVAEASARADQYIAEYNIWMHHLLNDQGERLFPKGMKLLTHWNLRDEVKAQYSQPQEQALPRQQMIQKVMERIVTQTIPAVVINNPHVDWDPYSNQVRPAAVEDSDLPAPEGMKITGSPEPNTRYDVLLDDFLAVKKIDPYSPTAPTHIARRFDEDREIPEERVRAMLEQMLSSPLFPRVAKLIERRLGRKLQPFDIWYSGFRPRGQYSEAELDQITRKRYPTSEAYAKDMPRMFVDLGFTPQEAAYLADNIVVEPARGSGHAWGAGMRSAPSRLRTRVGKDGMDYKGYNIAVHEMGHNVEQTFSLKQVDHYFLSGVPNTAFTEAMAFVFQDRDLELLGLAQPDETSRALKTLDDYWGACEIGAVALVDMAVWHWMYDHPNATPEELKQATIQISKDTWNRFFAPVFGQKDVALLGIYSHMIHSFLYLPDYPIGHMIAHQIEEQVEKSGKVGPEIERMSKIGNLPPDLWMQKATGAPVGPDALLSAAERALDKLEVTNAD